MSSSTWSLRFRYAEDAEDAVDTNEHTSGSRTQRKSCDIPVVQKQDEKVDRSRGVVCDS